MISGAPPSPRVLAVVPAPLLVERGDVVVRGDLPWALAGLVDRLRRTGPGRRRPASSAGRSASGVGTRGGQAGRSSPQSARHRDAGGPGSYDRRIMSAGTSAAAQSGVRPRGQRGRRLRGRAGRDGQPADGPELERAAAGAAGHPDGHADPDRVPAVGGLPAEVRPAHRRPSTGSTWPDRDRRPHDRAWPWRRSTCTAPCSASTPRHAGAVSNVMILRACCSASRWCSRGRCVLIFDVVVGRPPPAGWPGAASPCCWR